VLSMSDTATELALLTKPRRSERGPAVPLGSLEIFTSSDRVRTDWRILRSCLDGLIDGITGKRNHFYLTRFLSPFVNGKI